MPGSLAVVLGGAAGALARYQLDNLIQHRTFSIFPWSTFAINVSGCFLAGAWSLRWSTGTTGLPPCESGSWSASWAPTRLSRHSSKRRRPRADA